MDNQGHYIDIHSHLNLSPLYEMRDQVIERMKKEKIKTIVVGVDFETSEKAVSICKEFPEVCIGSTIGQHPNDNREEVFDFEKYKLLAQDSCVVGVGECGLDYFRLSGNEEEINLEKRRQMDLFIEHINLAKYTNKMLMIHARPSKGTMDAYEDTLNILEKENFTGKVNFHFFVGDSSIAKRVVEHNWTMSFDGPITFTNEYDEVILNTPLENILCETDAPFAAPTPHRGKTCEPWMVIEMYKKISQIKKLSLEDTKQQLYLNSSKLFS